MANIQTIDDLKAYIDQFPAAREAVRKEFGEEAHLHGLPDPERLFATEEEQQQIEAELEIRRNTAECNLDEVDIDDFDDCYEHLTDMFNQFTEQDTSLELQKYDIALRNLAHEACSAGISIEHVHIAAIQQNDVTTVLWSWDNGLVWYAFGTAEGGRKTLGLLGAASARARTIREEDEKAFREGEEHNRRKGTGYFAFSAADDDELMEIVRCCLMWWGDGAVLMYGLL